MGHGAVATGRAAALALACQRKGAATALGLSIGGGAAGVGHGTERGRGDTASTSAGWRAALACANGLLASILSGGDLPTLNAPFLLARRSAAGACAFSKPTATCPQAPAASDHHHHHKLRAAAVHVLGAGAAAHVLSGLGGGSVGGSAARLGYARVEEHHDACDNTTRNHDGDTVRLRADAGGTALVRHGVFGRPGGHCTGRRAAATRLHDVSGGLVCLAANLLSARIDFGAARLCISAALDARSEHRPAGPSADLRQAARDAAALGQSDHSRAACLYVGLRGKLRAIGANTAAFALNRFLVSLGVVRVAQPLYDPSTAATLYYTVHRSTVPKNKR